MQTPDQLGFFDLANRYAALRHQERLQPLYTGGTIFHVFLAERVAEAEGCKLLVKRIAHRFRIPCYAITPTFSICQDHEYLAGEHLSCPTCGKSAEVYSRVAGCHGPVQNCSEGKREEHRQRKPYAVRAAF